MPLRNSVKTKILLKSPDEKFNLKSSPLFSKDLFSSSQKPFPSYFPVKEPFTKDHPLLRPVLPGVGGGGVKDRFRPPPEACDIVTIGILLESEYSCPSGYLKATLCCMYDSIHTGVGKRLHRLPSHPELGEPWSSS